MSDTLTIRAVANGWIITPGACGVSDFTHVATTPVEVAQHVEAWANAQQTGPGRIKPKGQQ